MRDIIGPNGTCLERDCKIAIEGKIFEANGAFIEIDQNGKHWGYVYGSWKEPKVTNWHGDISCPAIYGRVWRSNIGDRRRAVWFTWRGIKFYGVWCNIDQNQLIRVREVK